MSAVLLPPSLGKGRRWESPWRAEEPGAKYLAQTEPAIARNFDLLAASPGGVAKLRELIFSLAARGLLVGSSGSAAERRLDSLAEFVMGQAPPGNACNTDGVGTTFVKTGEFGVLYPAVREWTTKPLKFARSGDVLICVVGATVGKLNLAIDCAIGRSVAAIRPNEDLLTKYLYYMLMPFTLGLRRNARGSAQGVIGKAELGSIVLRLPSRDEQSRIVARVEELMRLCDALEAKDKLEAAQHAQLLNTLLGTLTDSETPEALAENWLRVAAHFDLLIDRPEAVNALEQTILQLAVRGLLVPQDPADEPASVVLQRVCAQKDRLIADSKIKRDKPPSPLAEETSHLPPRWVAVRIDEIAEVQGGIQKTQLRRPIKQHYPYLRVANVQRDALWLDEIERFELTTEELGRWRLTAGDLLIVEGNGSANEIGRCAVWSGAIDSCVYQNHLIRVRCFQLEFMPFVKLFLNSPTGMDEMKRLAITTSGLYNLSVGKIRSFVLAFPPLAEQSRIVARVESLRRLCADLRERLIASQATQSHLAESLVASVTA